MDLPLRAWTVNTTSQLCEEVALGLLSNWSASATKKKTTLAAIKDDSATPSQLGDGNEHGDDAGEPESELGPKE